MPTNVGQIIGREIQAAARLKVFGYPWDREARPTRQEFEQALAALDPKWRPKKKAIARPYVSVKWSRAVPSTKLRRRSSAAR
jgi:hypothetical protein